MPNRCCRLDIRFFLYLNEAGNKFIQESIKGLVPIEEGSMYTIPQRDTVAGDATARSYTSNIIVMWGVRVNICPEFRHNFLLSSKTVFIDSIHKESTGPSKIIQCFSVDSSFTHYLTMYAKIPSAHSCVWSLN